MQTGATRFLVEEAYWAASAEALREFRAAAERLRPDDGTANDNLLDPPELREDPTV